MSMISKGIPYFPTSTNFFDEEVMELLEAKYGILASYSVMRLLCKIYKEGYYISWGQEQSIIFARKIGGEMKSELMGRIVELLLEKGFFDKGSYVEHGILTSEQIQKVWLQAIVRRKIDFSQLPYLLNVRQDKGKQKEEVGSKDAGNLPVQKELNSENAGISGQTKLNQSKPYEEEEKSETSLEIPQYAHNPVTHNVNGLLESLKRYKVTDFKETQTILRLSDYGRKGTLIWILFSSTTWSKIGAPGKYIIASLTNKR